MRALRRLFGGTAFALVTTWTMIIAPVTAAVSAPTAPVATTVVHVSPTGDDSTGTGSSTKPFQTLAKANAHLEATAPASDVEVRLEPGTYTEVGTRWTYRSSHTVTITGDGGTATFSGQNDTSAYLLKFGPESGPRVPMNLYVRNLRFTGSSNGAQVINATAVTLTDLQFDRIGTEYTGIGTGYAALSVQNVSGVGIWNPTFTDIVNDPEQLSLVHAIYAANDADNVTMHNVSITRVAGDPIRIRNGSNNLQVLGGTITQSGRYAAMSEWYHPDSEARSSGGLDGVTVSGGGFNAPHVHGRTVCIGSGSGSVSPCHITDVS